VRERGLAHKRQLAAKYLTRRLSDAELIKIFLSIDPEDAMVLGHAEMDRARASEAALLARVAALEAELAAMRDGLTGTPEKGACAHYWCEVNGGPVRDVCYWLVDHWTTRTKLELPPGVVVTRYWPLQGESYQ
jgi:hypothetical protein